MKNSKHDILSKCLKLRKPIVTYLIIKIFKCEITPKTTFEKKMSRNATEGVITSSIGVITPVKAS